MDRVFRVLGSRNLDGHKRRPAKKTCPTAGSGIEEPKRAKETETFSTLMPPQP
jgi:hypothetical protein